MLMACEIWRQRNDITHQHDNKRQKQVRKMLDEAIEQEYTQGTEFLAEDSLYLFIPQLENQLRKTLHYKASWIHSVEAARQESVLNNNVEPSDLHMYSRSRSFLRRWLQTKWF